MYDVFICHASEDKAEVADPLARALRDAEVKVWYDKFCLRIGDSLRQSIEEGLSLSTYGIVILSENFFGKKWPQEELDGLFAKQLCGQKTILPVWHKIGSEQVVSAAPMLAGKVAIRTEEGMDEVICKLMDLINPDSRHFSNEGKCVAVSPNHVRLYGDGWKAKNQVIIKNTNINPVYSVQIKFTLQPCDVDSSCLKLEPDSACNQVTESLQWLEVTNHAFAIDIIDSHQAQAVVLVLHTLLGQQTRFVGVVGTGPRDCSANVEVVDFQNQPKELFVKNGEIAIPFRLREECQIKAIRAFFKRKVMGCT